MKARDLMTSEARSVSSDANLADAANCMWVADCGALPVHAASSDTIVGMLTDRDICMAVWSKDLPAERITVAEAMSKKLVYCSASDSIAEALMLMRTYQVRRLPVLDERRRLVGILSIADLARGSGVGGPREHGVSPEQLVSTLAAICDSERPASPSA